MVALSRVVSVKMWRNGQILDMFTRKAKRVCVWIDILVWNRICPKVFVLSTQKNEVDIN